MDPTTLGIIGLVIGGAALIVAILTLVFPDFRHLLFGKPANTITFVETAGGTTVTVVKDQVAKLTPEPLDPSITVVHLKNGTQYGVQADLATVTGG